MLTPVLFLLTLTFSPLPALTSSYLHRSLLGRQEPGTPRYACHEACGGVITTARTDGFCELPDFRTQLEACLACANTFGIWRYYGDDVGAAAEQCGLSAQPLSSGAASDISEAATTDAVSLANGTQIATTDAASSALANGTGIPTGLTIELTATSTTEAIVAETDQAASLTESLVSILFHARLASIAPTDLSPTSTGCIFPAVVLDRERGAYFHGWCTFGGYAVGLH